MVTSRIYWPPFGVLQRSDVRSVSGVRIKEKSQKQILYIDLLMSIETLQLQKDPCGQYEATSWSGGNIKIMQLYLEPVAEQGKHLYDVFDLVESHIKISGIQFQTSETLLSVSIASIHMLPQLSRFSGALNWAKGKHKNKLILNQKTKIRR